jgi:S-adenosylmethionine hydrolase
VITLLTDFGLSDAYVGSMKGVLVGLCPEAAIVDVSHGIPPQDLLRAGLVWAAAVPYFPPGTVHVAVVDPGVGTRRRILAVEAEGRFFLAPDNGLLGYVLGRRSRIRRSVDVRRRELFLSPVSNTFHGRDIFAPVAARIAGGLPLAELGPRVRPVHWGRLPRTRTRRRARGSGWVIEEVGELLSIDSFGNVTTNIRPRDGSRLLELEFSGRVLRKLSKTYGDGAIGQPLVLEGSTGYLEVALNQGRADETLGLKPGMRVQALWKPRS